MTPSTCEAPLAIRFVLARMSLVPLGSGHSSVRADAQANVSKWPVADL